MISKKEAKKQNTVYNEASQIKFLIIAFERLSSQEENISKETKEMLVNRLSTTKDLSTKSIVIELEEIFKDYKFLFGIEDVIELSHKLEKERQIQSERAAIDPDVMIVLNHPNLFNLITEQELDKKIVGEIDTRKTIFLCACGRHVKNANPASFNLMVNSESGAGKDHVTTKTIEILPDKHYIKRTRISPTAFTYWHNSTFEPGWTWDGKVCYLEDISNNILNHEVFKVMCSSGSNTTVVINQKAVDIHIEGKPIMIITTASGTPNSEMIRRFTILNLDESKDQTKEVVKRQATLAAKGINPEYEEEIIDALAVLKRVKVIIPYAEKLTELFPPDHLIMRTHFSRFLDYIKASAALYQFQRKQDPNGNIIAEGSDYDIARIALLKTTSNPFMISLSKDYKEVLAVMKGLDRKAYSVSEIEPLVKISQKWLYRVLKDLKKYGFIREDKEKVEGSKRYTMVYSYIDINQISIPTWKDIDEYCRNRTIHTTHTTNTNNTSDTILALEEVIVSNVSIVQNFVQLKEPTYHKCHSCGTTPCHYEDLQGRVYCSVECIPKKNTGGGK